MDWSCFILGVAIGVVIAAVVNFVSSQNKAVGTIEMDMTNPKEPYLRLLMDNENFFHLHNKKYVMLRVDSTATFTRQKHGL